MEQPGGTMVPIRSEIEHELCTSIFVPLEIPLLKQVSSSLLDVIGDAKNLVGMGLIPSKLTTDYLCRLSSGMRFSLEAAHSLSTLSSSSAEPFPMEFPSLKPTRIFPESDFEYVTRVARTLDATKEDAQNGPTTTLVCMRKTPLQKRGFTRHCFLDSNSNRLSFLNYTLKSAREDTLNPVEFCTSVLANVDSRQGHFVAKSYVTRHCVYFRPDSNLLARHAQIKHVRLALTNEAIASGVGRARTTGEEYGQICMEIEFVEPPVSNFDELVQIFVSILVRMFRPTNFIVDEIFTSQNKFLATGVEMTPSILASYEKKNSFVNGIDDFFAFIDSINSFGGQTPFADVVANKLNASLHVKYDGIQCYALIHGTSVVFKFKMQAIWMSGYLNPPGLSTHPCIALTEVFIDKPMNGASTILLPGDFVIHTILSVLVPTFEKQTFRGAINQMSVTGHEIDEPLSRQNVVTDFRDDNCQHAHGGEEYFVAEDYSSERIDAADDDGASSSKECQIDESTISSQDACQQLTTMTTSTSKRHELNNTETSAPYYGQGVYNPYLPIVNGHVHPQNLNYDMFTFLNFSESFRALVATITHSASLGARHQSIARPLVNDIRQVAVNILRKDRTITCCLERRLARLKKSLALLFLTKRQLVRKAQRVEREWSQSNGDGRKMDGLFVSLWFDADHSWPMEMHAELNNTPDSLLRILPSCTLVNSQLATCGGSVNLKLKEFDTIELKARVLKTADRLEPIDVYTDTDYCVTDLCRTASGQPFTVLSEMISRDCAWHQTPCAIRVSGFDAEKIIILEFELRSEKDSGWPGVIYAYQRLRLDKPRADGVSKILQLVRQTQLSSALQRAECWQCTIHQSSLSEQLSSQSAFYEYLKKLFDIDHSEHCSLEFDDHLTNFVARLF